MKITMLSTDYHPNIGGVAQHIFEITRALVAAGDEVEVIAPIVTNRWSDLVRAPWLEDGPGFRVWRIPFCLNRSVKFLSGQISGRLSKRKFTREAVARLQATCPDVLHWHALDTIGYPAESFTGVRVWTNHTSNFIDGIPVASWRAHYQREASSADHLICPSQELADLTVNIGVPADRVHFISNGVDARRFNPANDGRGWRGRLGLRESDVLMLCSRRLEKKNGVRYFIQAALSLLDLPENSHWHFAVAGNFPGHRSESDESVVRELLAGSKREANIHLLGRVENTEIPGLYAAADLVVMPSLIEATSLSALEAMATGKAIVSTNVGGLPFLVRDGENGILVPPRNPERMAAAISDLLGHRDRMAEMGRNGRRRIEADLDWSKIAEQTRKYYRRMCL